MGLPLFDAASVGAIDAGSSGSHSHTCSTAPNRILLVGFCLRGGAAQRTVSGVTYNTVALTKLSDELFGDLFGDVELWYLINPASGANTLAYTLSGSCDASIGAVSYTNAIQVSPFGTPVEAEGAAGGDAGPATVNVGGVAAQLVVDVVATQANITITVGANQTQRVNNKQSTGTVRTVGMSEESGSGTITMSWTLSGDARWGIIAVVLKSPGGGFWFFFPTAIFAALHFFVGQLTSFFTRRLRTA